MKIRKAVMPLGGFGTRFLPVTKAVCKELLPIGDKPVVQWLIEEAVQSGIEEICLVLSREKELIRHYFSPDPALETFLKKRGKTDLISLVKPLHALAHFTFRYQEEPNGDGDALLSAETWVGNDPFLILFGDDVVDFKVPAAKQLMDGFKGEAVIAVERVPREQIALYGVIECGARLPAGQTRLYRNGQASGRRIEVKNLVEKPKPEAAPSEFGIIGKYVCPPEIFKALHAAKQADPLELRLIDGLKELLKSRRVFAYEIEGKRFDTGTPQGLFAANQNYFEKVLENNS